MKLFGMAVASPRVIILFIVASVPAVYAEEADSLNQVLQCPEEKTTKDIQITKPQATLEITCASNQEKTPAISDADVENVYTDPDCADQQALATVCSGASGTKLDNGVKFTFTQLPEEDATFYVQCPSSDQLRNCTVKVHVAAQATEGQGGQQGPDGQHGPGGQEGPQAQPVQQCADVGTSITLKIHGYGSAARFKCGSDLTLFPSDTGRVFEENCETEKNPEDLARTVSGSTYTLTATKKPRKKKLCYLCRSPATENVGKGKSTEYCAVYVETSAGNHVFSPSPGVLMLPCALAVLHFT
uniref:SRS domain-containing protein n=1 Tax=Sarcocystis aucheniae TaxID=65407 RepID=A0A5P9S3K9_9APIC|nr:hypothetical protein [Sarcocystis aucheniae]